MYTNTNELLKQIDNLELEKMIKFVDSAPRLTPNMSAEEAKTFKNKQQAHAREIKIRNKRSKIEYEFRKLLLEQNISVLSIERYNELLSSYIQDKLSQGEYHDVYQQ